MSGRTESSAGSFFYETTIKQETTTSIKQEMTAASDTDESDVTDGSSRKTNNNNSIKSESDVEENDLKSKEDKVVSNGSRQARNQAEKNRRDKLNNCVHELSTMVPHVVQAPRRTDKTGILRHTAHALRIAHVFGNKSGLSSRDQERLEFLNRLNDTFFLTITWRGEIVVVSPSIEHHLGHSQPDLLGQNIVKIVHPDDHHNLKQLLVPTDLEPLFEVQSDEVTGEPLPRTPEEEDEIDKKLASDRRSFQIRMARAGPRSEPTTYELVMMNGSFRRSDFAPRGVRASSSTNSTVMRRARGRADPIPLHSISSNDVVFIAKVTIIKPPTICDRLLEASKYEYKTRHLIDGRIVECDQRISLVAGYMTNEVHNLSAFTFMHKEDVRWVIFSLRRMYDNSSMVADSCYRLMTRTGQFIYLKTTGHLEVDPQTNQVHSFICVNTLVSDEEGRRMVREMKKRYSVFVSSLENNSDSNATSEMNVPGIENPQQLEKAILNLVTNLNLASAPDVAPSPDRGSSSGYMSDGELGRQVRSPPISLIAPKQATIKTAIKKSVPLVAASASSNPESHAPHSPYSRDANGGGPTTSKSPPLKLKTSSVILINNNSISANKNANVSKCSPPRDRRQQQSQKPISTIAEASQLSPPLINIKQESDTCEARIPPLPTCPGYFDGCSPPTNNGGYDPTSPAPFPPTSSTTSSTAQSSVITVVPNMYKTTVSSPSEFNVNQLNYPMLNNQPHPNDSLYGLGGNGDDSSCDDGGRHSETNCGRSNHARSQSVLKRTHSMAYDEQLNNGAKRRTTLIATTTTVTMADELASSPIDEKPTFLSSPTACMGDLSNPGSDLLQAMPSSFDEELDRLSDSDAHYFNIVVNPQHHQLNQIIDEHRQQQDYCSDGMASDSVISGTGSGIDDGTDVDNNGDNMIIAGVMDMNAIGGDLSGDFSASLLPNSLSVDEILSEDSKDFCHDVYLKPR